MGKRVLGAFAIVLIYSGASVAHGNACKNAVSALSDHRRRTFSMSLRLDTGQVLHLNGKMQIERESRIAITPSVNPLYEIVGEQVLQRGPEYQDLKKLTGQLLEWHSKRDSFYFTPLAVDEFTCHGSWVYEKSGSRQNEFKGEALITQIAGPKIEKLNSKEGDEHFLDYTVNAKSEFAQYFDTSHRALEQQGIAIRAKRWFSYGEENFDPHSAVATMITLKRFVNLIDNMQVREEWQVRVPNDLSEREIQVAMKELMKIAGANPPETPLTETNVFNKRFGIKWMRNKVQMGFLTVDYFGSNLNDSNSMHSQIELEILPDPKVIRILKENVADFKNFISRLKDFVDGPFIGYQPKVRAITEKPLQRVELQTPVGELKRFFAFESQFDVSGFEVKVEVPANGKSYLVGVKIPNTFETAFLKSARANIRFENDLLYIRRGGGDWVAMAKATGRILREVVSVGGRNVDATEYEVLTPGGLSVGIEGELVVQHESAMPSP